MSSHLHTSALRREQQVALIAEAKRHANTLREQAIDATWSTLRRQLIQGLAGLSQLLWPQSRTPRKEASSVISVGTRRVQNRPRSPLRLMDP